MLFVSRLSAGRVPEASLQGADEELQPVRATGPQRLPQPDRPLQLQPAADHGRGESPRTSQQLHIHKCEGLVVVRSQPSMCPTSSRGP